MAGGIAFSARLGLIGDLESLERAIINAARPKIRAAADRTGEASVDDIISEIDQTYGERKGKERSEPLATASNYTHTVNDSPRGVTLVFMVSGSDNFRKKFGALNFGAGPHVIAPVRAPALANRQDTSRSPRGFFSRTPVLWSSSTGKFGTKFWQTAVKRALDGFGSRV
jgi:hypothetical protein